MNKPNISKRAFWSYDFSKIDFEKDWDFVIGQIVDYGMDDKEFVEIIRFYGKEKVLSVIHSKLSNIDYRIKYFEVPANDDFILKRIKRLKIREEQAELVIQGD